MPRERLKRSVDELRDHLSTDSELDATRKDELDALATRIETMLSGEAEHWEESLVDQVEQRVLQYEEEHPVLAGMMREIMTTLSNMGL